MQEERRQTLYISNSWRKKRQDGEMREGMRVVTEGEVGRGRKPWEGGGSGGLKFASFFNITILPSVTFALLSLFSTNVFNFLHRLRM